MRRVLAALFVLASAPLVAQLRLAESPTADGQWLMYSGSYASHRFSPLRQISSENVANLRPSWVYQPPGTGPVESTPLFANGMLYVTAGPTAVSAVDVRSGKALWEWTRPIASSVLNLGFPRVNRGVAMLDDTLFVGTLDGYLVALDVRSGIERWTVHVGENPVGHSVTAAPLVVDNKVIVGISGGEAGIRGFLDAYDVKTGKQLWRYWTIPSPGEHGSDTWPADSWVHGGGATWLTGSYNPQLKLLYWGTGNPGPDWNGDSRLGDNFGTSSVVALDVETGKLRWSFQFTPHDVHDWDANQIPVLVDAEVGGRARSLLVMANRNAFYYALDRQTGEFLFGTPYAKQTWAKGLDDRGRPILIPGMDPTDKGTLVYPSLQGATNWASPSYSPATGLLYVPVREMGSVYYKTAVEYRPGHVLHRRIGKAARRRVVGSRPRARRQERQTGVGLPAPDADLGRRHVDGRWSGVQRFERRQLLRARREDRQGAVAVPDRRPDPIRTDVVCDERQTARRRRRRSCAVCLRAAGLAAEKCSSCLRGPDDRIDRLERSVGQSEDRGDRRRGPVEHARRQNAQVDDENRGHRQREAGGHGRRHQPGWRLPRSHVHLHDDSQIEENGDDARQDADDGQTIVPRLDCGAEDVPLGDEAREWRESAEREQKYRHQTGKPRPLVPQAREVIDLIVGADPSSRAGR